MARDNRNTPNEPFDGEFDPSVFDKEFDISLDDDFKDYFDEDIVVSELEARGKMFSTNEENFGRDGVKQVYSAEEGMKTSSPDLDHTQVVADHKEIKKKAKGLDGTKKIDVMELKNKIKIKEKAPKANEDEDMAKRRKSKKNDIWSLFDNKLFYALFVLCAAVLMAGVVWIMSTDILGFTKEDNEVTVTIPKDYTMGEVAKILKEEDVIKFRGLFQIFAIISNADEKISGGTYLLNQNYDYRAIVNGMTKSGGKRVEVDVTLPEGLNMAQMFAILEEKSVCYAEDLWEAAKNYDFDYDFLDDSTLGQERRLEGFLFPDTYKFYLNDTPENVLDKMLDNFDNRVTTEMRDTIKANGYSLRDVIIIASIIEEEAAGDADRDKVASVIYNRLKNPSGPTVGFLQLDSTINYIIYGTDTKFSLELDSPYNTYKYKGLPAGPISNPGLKAIKAAITPASTNYYYFAINKNYETQFFSSYNAFLNFTNSSEYGG